MRKLIVVLVGMLLACSARADYLRTIGTGVDFESAKNNAIVSAIEIYAGTVVVSEKEILNKKLIKDEILTYSSGYINDYKVISQTQLGNQIQVVLDVSVNTNKISHRILGRMPSSENIDGNKVKTQIETFQRERDNADKLLKNVLKGYPYHAYRVQTLNPYISTEDRNMQLVMPYKLSWNYYYLMALNEVLVKTQDANPGFLKRAISNVTVMAKDPKDYVFGNRSVFQFNDMTQPHMITNTMYDEELRIMARVINKSNDTVWWICHHPKFLSGKSDTFYSIGDAKNIVFFGNIIETGEVRLDIGPDLNRLLQDFYKVQLQIVKHKDC